MPSALVEPISRAGSIGPRELAGVRRREACLGVAQRYSLPVITHSAPLRSVIFAVTTLTEPALHQPRPIRNIRTVTPQRHDPRRDHQRRRSSCHPKQQLFDEARRLLSDPRRERGQRPSPGLGLPVLLVQQAARAELDAGIVGDRGQVLDRTGDRPGGSLDTTGPSCESISRAAASPGRQFRDHELRSGCKDVELDSAELLGAVDDHAGQVATASPRGRGSRITLTNLLNGHAALSGHMALRLALTKNFADTVRARTQRGSGFRRALQGARRSRACSRGTSALARFSAITSTPRSGLNGSAH